MNKIIEFQMANGLKSDGTIGSKTASKLMEVLGILTIEHFCHFIAQTSHETGGFEASVENLNYSSDRLRAVFPKYFPTPASALPYHRQPEKIANKVYANRMGNGDEASGDGWKYRGRGSLQLTGKSNYKAFSDWVKDPEVMTNPELVAGKYYFDSALFFFARNGLWTIASKIDMESIKKLTKKINGGYNGLDHRTEMTNKYYKLLS
jgi:putative chitinase